MLSDTFADECAEVGLSDAAFRTHVEALGYTMKRDNRTCGRIRQALVRRILSAEDPATAIAQLVEAGFWQVADDGDGWVVIHQMEYQRTAEQIDHDRARNRAKQERYRARARNAVTNRGSNPVTNPVTDPNSNPAPTQPNPT